ncbi:hypothetical protein OUZ56_017071 [Daphnia magna]|uniref:Uncharacterized protein n=1 Tax=Daphnia magna TaxID=35525 RepID=A0ABR0AS35_9CRUS|nr:hypothetical protein OUZ56_017071 [Daphnia magna]
MDQDALTMALKNLMANQQQQQQMFQIQQQQMLQQQDVLTALANRLLTVPAAAVPIIPALAPTAIIRTKRNSDIKYEGLNGESLQDWLQLINRKALAESWQNVDKRREAMSSLFEYSKVKLCNNNYVRLSDNEDFGDENASPNTNHVSQPNASSTVIPLKKLVLPAEFFTYVGEVPGQNASLYRHFLNHDPNQELGYLKLWEDAVKNLDNSKSLNNTPISVNRRAIITQEDLDSWVLNFLVVDVLPIYTVEKPGFKQLLTNNNQMLNN